MDKEYISITSDIINNKKFKSLHKETHHHCTTRFEHSYNVALNTYKVCKKLKLDYISATRAALVHDFFYNKEFSNKLKKLIMHHKEAIKNAKKIIKLTKKEEDMIASHMFPIGGQLPTSKEAIILDLVDDIVSIQEKIVANKNRLKRLATTTCIILFSLFTR